MKKNKQTRLLWLIAVIALTVSFSACKKEKNPEQVLDERIDLAVSKPESASVGFQGDLVTGMARVYQTNGKYQLALENFNSTSGPDLWVYLSKTPTATADYASLGVLRALSGNQVYDIPSTVNVKDYSYVLIYCVSYKHLYGYAKLTF